MIVSIASGKGGTGKTTVATSLATSVAGKVQFADCDVEEPNAHLFLRPALGAEEPVHALVPEVDLNKCTFCEKCRDFCQYHAIAVLGDQVLVFAELCHACGGCKRECPEDAITYTKREIGVVQRGSVNGIDFVHGRLRIGEPKSPPLIREVKKRLDPAKPAIIDVPPGTSCPVIEAVRGSSFCVLVTEETPFGLYDLRLAVEMLRALEIPHGVLINRATPGLDQAGVKRYCHDERIDILMEIPLDRHIAEAYSKGEILVEAMPGYRKYFRGLYDKICQAVS